MKKNLLLLVFLTSIVLNAQISLYSFSESTEVYTPVVGTTSTVVGDESFQNNVSIGFTFQFNSVNHSAISISSNGLIRLSNNPFFFSTAENNISSSANSPIIAPFWDDNNIATGSVKYATTGIAPNRIFEVGWENINIGGDGATSSTNFASFKLRLYETTNVIEFVYGPTLNLAGVLSASIGVNNGNFISVTPNNPSTSSKTVANNNINSTVNLVGKKFIISPPLPCSGIPTGGIITPNQLFVCDNFPVPTLQAVGYTTNVTNLSYQWEERRADTGGFFVPAVGGTGATTANYTPPTFLGSFIEYRMRIICQSSGGGIEYSNIVNVQQPTTGPNTPVTNTTYVGTADGQGTISWTNGNGNRRVVLLSNSNSFTNYSNGSNTGFNPNTIYAGTGQQVMYDGTGNTVNITGLLQNISYYIKVIEYHRCGITGNYTSYYNNSSGSNVYQIIAPEYANLQFPATANTIEHTTQVTVYGQIYKAGLTDIAPNINGQAPGIEAWIGISPVGSNSNPATWTNWIPATHNAGMIGNNDEYQANIGATLSNGTYYYAFRYRINNGNFTYGGYSFTAGGFWNGTTNVSGVIDVSNVSVPSNNFCANDIELTVGTTFNDNAIVANTAGCFSSSTTPFPTCGEFSNQTKDLWYTVNVPASGSLTIETENNPGSLLSDTVLNIYTRFSSCSNLSNLECNDDKTPTNLYSKVTLSGRNPGENLYIRAFGYATLAGSFRISAYDTTLSTAENYKFIAFKIYPNPTTDILNIESNQIVDSVIIYNMLGQVLLQKEIRLNKTSIPISHLNKGTYNVKLISKEFDSKVLKLIKD